MVNHGRIVSYFFVTPLFNLRSVVLTVTNTVSAILSDFHIGQTNLETIATALTSCGPGHSRSSMQWFCSLLDSLSVAQLSMLSFGFSNCPFQFSQFSASEMLAGVLSSSLSSGWWLILRIWRTFKIWVYPPGRSSADTAGAKEDHSDNFNAATPSCWKSDQDALLISSVSKIYPPAVICGLSTVFLLCITLILAALTHLQKVVDLAHSVQCPLLRLFLHFWVVACVSRIRYWVISLHNPNIGSSKPPDNNFFAKGLACDFWLPPSNQIGPKWRTVLYSDTIWYDTDYVACHIGMISVHWVRFVLLAPPVGYVQFPTATANFYWVGVVVIEIWMNLHPVLKRFRLRIQIEPGGSQLAYCRIASSVCLPSHTVRCWVLFIITRHIIWIKGRLTESSSRCRGDEIAAL